MSDLISREALKEHKFTTQVANGVEIQDIEVVPVASIDNAPTVEVENAITAHENIGYEKGFRDGYAQCVADNERSDAKYLEERDADAWESGYIQGLSERDKGEWIRTGSLGNGNAQYECSNCHYGDEHAESQEVPYCWHCGAKMKGGAE